MADKIVVLRAGRVEQVGTPLDLYNHPAQPLRRRLHRLAADELPGRRASRPRRRRWPRVVLDAACDAPHRAVAACARHGRRRHARARSAFAPSTCARRRCRSRRSTLDATIERVEQLGAASFLYCTLPSGEQLTVQRAGQVRAARRRQRRRVQFPMRRAHRVRRGGRASAALRAPADACVPIAARDASLAGMRADGAASLRARRRLAMPRLRARRRPRARAVRARQRGLQGAAHLDGRARRRRRAVGRAAIGSTSSGFARARIRRRRARATRCVVSTAALSLARAPATRSAFAGRRPAARRSPQDRADRRLPVERAQRRRAPLHGARAQRPATSGSATRPGRSTSTAGACARWRSTRSATTRETSRSAVQALAVPDRPRRRAAASPTAMFYDTLAPADLRPGLRVRQLSRLLPLRRDRRRRPRLLRLRRARRVRDVVRKFTELTGRMAFGPRWSLGYANTAMSLADAPDAQARLARFVDEARSSTTSRCSAFHFGSGYTQHRQAPLRVHLESRQVSRRRARPIADVRAPRHARRREPQAVPARRSSRVRARSPRRGAFVNDARTGAPCIGQFWDGDGAHVDFTHPDGIRWWQEGLRAQVLDYGIDAGWNDNNEYEIWDDDGASHGFGTSRFRSSARGRCSALLMTRATAKRRPRTGRTSASTPSRAPDRPASSATRRPGRATTRRAGTRCAGTSAWGST